MNKMPCRITDEHHSNDMTPMEEAIQEEEAAAKEERIKDAVASMKKNMVSICEAFDADYDLVADVAAVLAEYNSAEYTGYPATNTMRKVEAFAAIQHRLDVVLTLIAEEDD